MGVKAGLDPELMVRMLNASSGRSFPTERFAVGPVLGRRFDFGFRMELMAKDMRFALEEAEALGLVMPTCGAAAQPPPGELTSPNGRSYWPYDDSSLLSQLPNRPPVAVTTPDSALEAAMAVMLPERRKYVRELPLRNRKHVRDLHAGKPVFVIGGRSMPIAANRHLEPPGA